MLRTIIVAILLIPFILVTLPFVGIGFLLGKLHKKTQYKIAWIIGVIYSAAFFIVAGAKITIKGRENIPKNIPSMLFVGNHKSYIDIPLLARYVGIPVAFIAKDGLKKAPLLNIIMIMMGCLFLQRDNVRQAFEIIMQGIKKLEEGNSLVIFPEGTRSKDDNLLPFKQGSLKLAEKAHVPVIPFALKGTNDVFGNQGYKIKSGRIWLTFGEPIYLEQLDPAQQKRSATYVQEIIKSMYDQMK